MKKRVVPPVVITLLLWLAYLAYEFLYVQPWIARTPGPIIRVDLLPIYALLSVMTLVSLWFLFFSKK